MFRSMAKRNELSLSLALLADWAFFLFPPPPSSHTPHHSALIDYSRTLLQEAKHAVIGNKVIFSLYSYSHIRIRKSVRAMILAGGMLPTTEGEEGEEE